jgi:hypothetical protein
VTSSSTNVGANSVTKTAAWIYLGEFLSGNVIRDTISARAGLGKPIGAGTPTAGSMSQLAPIVNSQFGLSSQFLMLKAALGAWFRSKFMSVMSPPASQTSNCQVITLRTSSATQLPYRHLLHDRREDRSQGVDFLSIGDHHIAHHTRCSQYRRSRRPSTAGHGDACVIRMTQRHQ